MKRWGNGGATAATTTTNTNTNMLFGVLYIYIKFGMNQSYTCCLIYTYIKETVKLTTEALNWCCDNKLGWMNHKLVRRRMFYWLAMDCKPVSVICTSMMDFTITEGASQHGNGCSWRPSLWGGQIDKGRCTFWGRHRTQKVLTTLPRSETHLLRATWLPLTGCSRRRTRNSSHSRRFPDPTARIIWPGTRRGLPLLPHLATWRSLTGSPSAEPGYSLPALPQPLIRCA